MGRREAESPRAERKTSERLKTFSHRLDGYVGARPKGILLGAVGTGLLFGSLAGMPAERRR